MHTVSIAPLAKGTPFARTVQVLGRNQGVIISAAHEAERFIDTPQVALALRTAVTGLDTGATLAQYGIARDFLELLSTVGAVERLKARMFPAAFRVRTPVETTSPSANWVGEYGPIPVTSAVFGSVTLDLTKIGSIAVLTKELIQFSSPSAEASIIRILRNSIAYTEDRKFLDPSIANVADQNPASVTYNGVVVVTTGATSAAIATDLSAMTNALVTWRDPAWIMLPKTLAYINAHNDGNLLHYNGTQAFLLGLPVFTTLGSPAQIALVDLGSIAIADNGEIDVAISTEATIELDTVPAQGEQSPISDISTLKSFWQNNLIGVKILRSISWQRAQTGAVVYMVVAY